MPYKKRWLKPTSQIVTVLICSIAAGMFLSGNAIEFGQKFLTKISPESSSTDAATDVDRIAAEISVKILDSKFLGSGFIVQKKGDRYTVITNQHVLRAGEEPYSIQTSDGKIHLATVVEEGAIDDYEYDLATLEFTTDVDYTIAKIGSSVYLEVGEPVFAVGFPYSEIEPATSTNADEVSGLAVKRGRIAMILNQALVEGYQIGYTNDVKKGMSGGPLLNSSGEVVGINGKHAYPLWESPELYQDGSQPCPALEELIVRSSLAIPIEKSIDLNPQLESLRPKSNIEVSRKSNLLSENPELVARMQTEAEATLASCENYNGDTVRDYPDEE